MQSRELLATKIEEAAQIIAVKPVAAYLKQTLNEINIRIRQLAVLDWCTTYEISCYLYAIDKGKLWCRPQFCARADNYRSFYAWVYGELGIGERKARYLKAAARRLHELKTPATTVKELFLLGWPKACQVLRIAQSTPELSEWIETASFMTENEVIKTVNLAVATSNNAVLGIEKSGGVIDAPLKDNIDYKVIFDSASSFSFFKKAQAKAERRLGDLSSGQVLGILAAHYLSSTFPGEGFTEIPTEIEYKINDFVSSIKGEYDLDLVVAVDNDPRNVSNHTPRSTKAGNGSSA